MSPGPLLQLHLRPQVGLLIVVVAVVTLHDVTGGDVVIEGFARGGGGLEGGAKIVNPVYRGKKGHPVLFDRSLFDEILSLPRHETVRDLIRGHAGGRRSVEAGRWAITDLDTPEDLRVALREFVG